MERRETRWRRRGRGGGWRRGRVGGARLRLGPADACGGVGAHARACKPVLAWVSACAQLRLSHKGERQHSQRRRARGMRGPCLCVRV